jgi:carbon-monoxide dehydrogenase medium subunit
MARPDEPSREAWIMYLPEIVLHEPETIAEACELLDAYCDRSKILAGGTDLLVDLKQGRIHGIDHLISLKKIAGLGSIEDMEESIRIGALVTLRQASEDTNIKSHFPALVDTIDSMAAYPVRSIATLVGNIAGAVPSSDLAPFFIAAGAEAVLSDGHLERTVKIESYYVGPRETVCGDREITTHLVVPKPHRSTGMSYQKFMLRGANALAVAGVAAMLVLESGEPDKVPDGAGSNSILEGRIVLTAVAPTPVIARKAGGHLTGKPPSRRVFEEAASIARQEAKPITDIRGTAGYRSELVEVLTKRALEEALARARTEDA